MGLDEDLFTSIIVDCLGTIFYILWNQPEVGLVGAAPVSLAMQDENHE